METSSALATRNSTPLAIVETAASAAAAQAMAMVNARYEMAIRQPRNWDQFRIDTLAECKRPTFAHNKSAYYHKPIGKGVEGLGIRFVEVALRCMKNVLVQSSIIFEDAEKEIHQVTVTDLESNLTYPLDVRVSKTVERSKALDDGTYLSVRKNSWGKDVYTVPATDDDLLNKRAALISKAIRTLGLRIIPGDIQDEAEEIIKKIRLDKAAEDPTAERKRIADAFAEIGVKATDLVTYLGHSLDTCSPPELVQLRAIFGAIKDGEATWKQVMENKAAENPPGGGAGDGGDTGPKTYPDKEFVEAMKKWQAVILSGKKTAEQIIAQASTKHPLTDAQKTMIRAVKKAESTDGKASAEQIKSIREKAEKGAIADADIFKKFGIATFDGLSADKVEPILAFIANPTGA
jgi:hypothetical protein